MKKLWLIVLGFILLIFSGQVVPAYAETLSETVKEELEKIDFSEIENLSVVKNSGFFDSFFSFIEKTLNGEITFDESTLLSYVFDGLTSVIKSMLPVFIAVLVFGTAFRFLNQFDFFGKCVGEALFLTCYGGILLSFLPLLGKCFTETQNALKTYQSIISATTPILLTLMVSAGAGVSASVFSPFVVAVGNVIVRVFETVAFPVLRVFSVTGTLNPLTDDIDFSGINKAVLSVLKGVFGFLFTVFTLFITVKGIMSGSLDGMQIRATKFALQNSVPIIGGYLSTGFDFLVAGSLLIKNAVGFGTVVLLFLTALKPVLFLLSAQILCKLSGGILLMISDKRFYRFFDEISKIFSFFLAMVIGVGFVLFVLYFLLLISTNMIAV